MALAPILTIPIPSPTASGLLGAVPATTKQLGYCGFTLRTTVAGVMNIRELTVTGKILDTVQLIINTSLQWQYDPPLHSEGDIYLEILSGTWVGSIRVC